MRSDPYHVERARTHTKFEVAQIHIKFEVEKIQTKVEEIRFI